MNFLYYQIWGVSILRIVVSIGIILLAAILNKFIIKKILKLIQRIAGKSRVGFTSKVLESFEKPLINLVMITAIYVAIINILFQNENLIMIHRLYRVSIIITISIGFYNLLATSSVIFDRFGKKYRVQTSEVIKSFLSKIARVILVIIAITLVAKEFNYDLGTLVAGLGIAGLAVSMAAKDTLANLIAGIIIVFDKPFDLGDWISNSEVEGVVEEINFRNTRIRTFEKELICVPNLNLVSEALKNHSERKMRRVKFALGLTYETNSSQMIVFREAVEKYLMSLNEIDKESIVVRFSDFNDSSLDIMIMYFVKTTEYTEYMKIKESVNLELMNIVEKQGLSVAFPTQSLYFENGLAVGGLK